MIYKCVEEHIFCDVQDYIIFYFGGFPRFNSKKATKKFGREVIRPNFSCSNNCNSLAICRSFFSCDMAPTACVAPGRITLSKRT